MKFRTGFATALLGASIAIASPLFLASAFAQGGPGGPPPVTVAKPVVKDIVEQDEFTGRFEAVDSVDLRARVSGYLEAVKFRDGEIVKAGDLLFVIDKRPYQAAYNRA